MIVVMGAAGHTKFLSTLGGVLVVLVLVPRKAPVSPLQTPEYIQKVNVVINFWMFSKPSCMKMGAVWAIESEMRCIVVRTSFFCSEQ